MERTPEGRSLRLLRPWLSPGQRTQFAKESYFEVVGSDTGKRYRIHAGAATNVCELDESSRPTHGLCFLPMGELPIGDVMLSQKIALESYGTARSQWPRASSGMARSDMGFFAELTGVNCPLYVRRKHSQAQSQMRA
jgi:hypothetical protein